LNGSVTGATTTGNWSGGSGAFATSSSDLNAVYTPTASEIASGNLVLTLTSTNNGNCITVNDIVQISFVAPPFANFNGIDVCLGNTTNFTDFSLPGYGTLATWDWNFDDGNVSINQNPSNVYLAFGTYDVSLIVTNSIGCSDTIVKQVDVFDQPNASFTYVASCPGNQVIINFTDNSTSTDPINYWFYDFGGQGANASANPTQMFNTDGDYTITHIVSTTNGCSDTIEQIISVPAIPVAGFYYNTSNGMNVGAIFNFVDTSLYSTNYAWQFGDGNSSILQNPSNTYFANGEYLVTQYAYGALGCYDSTSTLITINTVTTEINTLIPNAISPNDDNKNDVWKLEFIDLLFPNATVEIYNQWGQQLFYSTGYSTPWDGKYEGELVPDGNYFYIINLNAGLEIDQFKGALLVLKSRK
jgi:gliding motility-associated-like protein